VALTDDLAALQAKSKSYLEALQAKSKADLAALEAKATARQEELRRQAADELAQVKASEEEARAHLKAIYQRLSTLGGRSTDNGILLSLAEREVRFGTAKADLPPGDIPSLDQIATVLVEYPELKVRIEGHTDNSGRDETNLALSQKRAEAVMEALVQRGVAGERLTALGIGEARPIASNETQAGRSQNRRVEIYVLEP
jgi:outer membrane protein OmpA-like peptidoglycan-associated protein